MSLLSRKMGVRLAATVVMAAFCASAWASEVPGEESSPYVATATNPVIALRVPAEESITFRGVVSFDEVGTGSLNMLYPGANAGSFVGSVIVHGLFVAAEKREQKEKLQSEADEVLLPYQSVLSGYPQAELMRQGLAQTVVHGDKLLIGATDQPGDGWLIETSPGFSMTQDQKAIILDNAIVIHRPDAASDAAFRNIVRVVSSPRTEEDPVAYWTSNDGASLKDETAGLFAESLDIALAEAMTGSPQNGNPHRTYRYPEGGIERMERAQLVSEHCNRLVIRTLRGWLLSIPAKSDTGLPTKCEAAGPLPQLAHDVGKTLE